MAAPSIGITSNMASERESKEVSLVSELLIYCGIILNVFIFFFL